MEGYKENHLPPLDSPVWKCSLCSNVLEDPQTLPCLHSLCAKCVDAQKKKPCTNERKKICPHCEFTRDEETKAVPDFFIKNVIDYLRMVGDHCEHKKCSFCQLRNKDTVPVSICITCLDLLCDECSKYHILTRLTKDHEVKSLQNVCDGMYEQEIRCLQRVPCTDEHTYLKLYCRTCNVLACEDCVFNEHMKHDVVKAEEQSKEEREKLSAIIKPLHNSCEVLNKFRTNQKCKLDETKNIKEKLLQKIRLGKENFIKEIEEQAMNAESHIQKLFKDTEKKLEEDCKSIGKTYSDLKYKVDRCSIVIHKANDVEFMHLKDILTSGIDTLSFRIQDYDSDNEAEPTVSVTIGDGLGNLFTILEKDASTASNPVNVPHVENSEDVSKNSSSDSIVYSAIGNCRINSDRYQPVISDVCWITDTSFIVADTNNNVAKIFDDKNNFLWKIEAENVTNVACIDGIVVCNSKTQVLLYKDRVSCGKINYGSNYSKPFGIMRGKEVRHIYIAEHGSCSTFRVYTKEGRRHGSVNLDMKVFPVYLAQSKEGTVELIDRTSKSIKRVSKNGNVSKFYTHSDDWNPIAMAADKKNNIYIVETLSSRLLKISESGQFISSKDLPIENPVGLSISSNGRFLVCKQSGTACVFRD